MRNGWMRQRLFMKAYLPCARTLALDLRLMMIKKQFPPSWQNQLAQLGFEDLTAIQEKMFEPISAGDTVAGD